MRGRRWLLPGALAAVTGVLAYLWCWSLTEQEPLVVAVRDVAVGQVLQPEDIATHWVPVGPGQPGALRSNRAAVGQRASTGLVAGQTILQGQLASRSALAAALRRDERAVFVPVAAGAPLGGALVAGDVVDLVGLRPEGAEWLARSARVLAVQTNEGDGGVLVAVSEHSAPLVAAGAIRGEVTLVLAPLEKEVSHGTARAGG